LPVLFSKNFWKKKEAIKAQREYVKQRKAIQLYNQGYDFTKILLEVQRTSF